MTDRAEVEPAVPPAEAYGPLLKAALSEGLPTLLLVVREEHDLTPQGRAVLAELEPHVTDVQKATEWPGTTLVGHAATVRRIEYGADVEKTMRHAARSLFDWMEPELPEDPCFLREDGSPWLTTISHEGAAWLTLSARERDRVGRHLPLVDLVHLESPWRPGRVWDR